MWRRLLGFSIIFYMVLTDVITAPTHYYSHRPTYTVNAPVVHRKPFIEARNFTYRGNGPREEARAMCSVRTQEVNATANATITRRLHGVVTSRELHNSVQRLELIIYGQMQQLWQSLDALRGQLAGDARSTLPDRRTVTFRIKPNRK